MPNTPPPISQTADELTAAMYRAGMTNVHVEPIGPPVAPKFRLKRAKSNTAELPGF
jgi:hypothetical protein